MQKKPAALPLASVVNILDERIGWPTSNRLRQAALLLAGIASISGVSPAFAGEDVQQAALVRPNDAAPIPLVNISVMGGNDRRHDSRGTAFLVARDTWATAGHVVRGCAAVYVRSDKGWKRAREVFLHPLADLAVIKAPSDGGQALLPLADRDPTIGQSGVHLGYAHGQLVFVETSLSAAANVRQVAQPEAGISAGWLWRQRGGGAQDSHLSGISGGPQIDANGIVQGITISYTGNPIRMTTVPAATLRGFLPAGTPLADPRSSNRIASRSNVVAAPQFAASAGVTSVYCAVSARTRPAN
jgi:S1-C subfamily serine protease